MRNKSLALLAAMVLSVVVVAGCSSGGGSSSSDDSSSAAAAATTVAPSGGNKTQFCADNATLDQATANVTDAESALAALTANESTIDDFGAQAPPDIADAANTLVSASKAAIASGDATGLQTQAFQTAGQAVDAYCGQNADGSPVTTIAGASGDSGAGDSTSGASGDSGDSGDSGSGDTTTTTP